MDVHRSARKHGIADADSIHAAQQFLVAYPLGEGEEPRRELTANGTIADGFTWSDPARTDSPLQLLTSEGLILTNGIAAPERRLGPAQLGKLLRDHA